MIAFQVTRYDDPPTLTGEDSGFVALSVELPPVTRAVGDKSSLYTDRLSGKYINRYRFLPFQFQLDINTNYKVHGLQLGIIVSA